MNKATFDAMLAQYKQQDVSGEGAVSWDNGVHCVLPEVLVYGKAIQNGTPTPDAPVMPEFSVGTTVQCGDTVAVAPELLAIPGTEYRDEWDAQTGKGVRRVGKYTLPNSGWSPYSNVNGDYYKFSITVPDGLNGIRNPTRKSTFSTHLIGLTNEDLNIREFSGILVRDGQIRIKLPLATVPEVEQFLTDNEVTVWYALAEPVPFQTDPAPLIAPKGTGHIMQVGGTIDAVPISAKYVTHS